MMSKERELPEWVMPEWVKTEWLTMQGWGELQPWNHYEVALHLDHRCIVIDRAGFVTIEECDQKVTLAFFGLGRLALAFAYAERIAREIIAAQKAAEEARNGA